MTVTNKTITMSRELVAEAAIMLKQTGTDDALAEDLRTALAEPVPPASGEPEVVCYEYVSKCGNQVGFGTSPVFRVKERGEKNPLIRLSDHRAHVTRLQAEVERLNSELMLHHRHCSGAYSAVLGQNDALQAEVERLKTMSDNYCSLLMDANSELTKARELFRDIANDPEMWSICSIALARRIDEQLSNQSAPADKDSA